MSMSRGYDVIVSCMPRLDLPVPWTAAAMKHVFSYVIL